MASPPALQTDETLKALALEVANSYIEYRTVQTAKDRISQHFPVRQTNQIRDALAEYNRVKDRLFDHTRDINPQLCPGRHADYYFMLLEQAKPTIFALLNGYILAIAAEKGLATPPGNAYFTIEPLPGLPPSGNNR